MSSPSNAHRFILSIPVADRPQHLRRCLESIHRQLVGYGYDGGLSVVVAEDSRDEGCIEQHRTLAAEYRGKGLEVIHFDLPEQYRLLQEVPEALRRRLGRLLTDQPPERFYRKGQAANRNLSYLKMLELTQDRGRTLYYLVDSDQLFLPEIDYFHPIDQIFRTTDTLMLTGKLVGDPPVSPAVMAANLLGDLTAFLHEIAGCAPEEPCRFHRDAPLPGDAAYHDLAKLFGFEHPVEHFDYRCPIHGPHDHAACLATFADRLPAFFYGEHPTRRTAFQDTGNPTALAPARTVYPGNYIVNFAGLKYIIPFGHLRLRMSGPTAGRLIQAEIGARFASANLPMLHQRTDEEGRDDSRPGVDRQADRLIDISDEFERQFFGDLMLFSVVEWLKHHPLDRLTDAGLVDGVAAQVETELLGLYQAKHETVNQRLGELGPWIREEGHWWRETPTFRKMERFLRNIEMNFGDQSTAWQQIQSPSHRAGRRGQIVDALAHYRRERDAWDELVSREF